MAVHNSPKRYIFFEEKKIQEFIHETVYFLFIGNGRNQNSTQTDVSMQKPKEKINLNLTVGRNYCMNREECKMVGEMYQESCTGCKSNGLKPAHIGIRDKCTNQRCEISYTRPDVYDVCSSHLLQVKDSHQIHHEVG